jgi:hypothetical protein
MFFKTLGFAAFCVKRRTTLFFAFLTFASFLFFYFLTVSGNVLKTIEKNGFTTFSVLIYGTEKMFPGRLESFVALYDKKSGVLKLLSINADIVILKKKEKAKSLKVLFNEASKKDINFAIQDFYSNLGKVIGNAARSDFYINVSFEDLNALSGENRKLKDFFSKDSFENKNIETLNHLDIAETILELSPVIARRIIFNGYSRVNTNISKKSFVSAVLKLMFFKPPLAFCEMPVQYARKRIEPDKKNIEKFLSKAYYAGGGDFKSDWELKVEVKNASLKPRMAQKAAWLLRDNKIDVLDYGNSDFVSDRTLIKDYKGCFKRSLEIAKILNVGKVIVSYDEKQFYDIGVFIGKDCEIYDIFDKGGRDGED